MNAFERADLRRSQVRDYRASGMSMVDWCREHGVGYSAFRRWVRQCPHEGPAAILEPCHGDGDWLEVDTGVLCGDAGPAAPASPRVAPVVRVVVDGAVVEIPPGADPGTVRMLMDAVMGR